METLMEETEQNLDNLELASYSRDSFMSFDIFEHSIRDKSPDSAKNEQKNMLKEATEVELAQDASMVMESLYLSAFSEPLETSSQISPGSTAVSNAECHLNEDFESSFMQESLNNTDYFGYSFDEFDGEHGALPDSDSEKENESPFTRKHQYKGGVMSKNHDSRISTGSVGEKLIMRTSSIRGSFRDTITKALRSTLRRTDKSPEKARREASESSCAESSITASPPRSSSSSSSIVTHRTSSGFGSLSHLPPAAARRPSRTVDLMSHSMYEGSAGGSPRGQLRKPTSRSNSKEVLTASPSLATLKNYEMHDLDDYDDCNSVISTASTSRIFSSSNPRRIKKQSLRSFLDSPVRLRRREPQRELQDAVEAGFEPKSSVPRCHSTHSIGTFNQSQFQPDMYRMPQEREPYGSREYATPMAVVGPSAQKSRGAVGSQSAVDQMNMENNRTPMDQRRSLQTINTTVTTSRFDGYRGEESVPVAASSMWNTSGNGNRRISHNNSHLDRHRDRLNSNEIRFDSTVVTSTPINKVAVAPLHKSSGRHRERDDIRTHHVAPMDRRSGQMIYSGERLVDGPVSPKSQRLIQNLEARVRDLESMVPSPSQPSTSMVYPGVMQVTTPTMNSKMHHLRSSNPTAQLIISSPDATSYAQQLMAKDIVAKEVEIERLHNKLQGALNQMHEQQKEYDQKVRKFKQDSEAAKDELQRVLSKLNELDAEYHMYRDNAARMPDSSTVTDLEIKIRKQKDELMRYQQYAREKEQLEQSYGKVKRELEFMDLQNGSLLKMVDDKEKKVKELQDNIQSLKQESALYHQSCSSGSTPLADETESLHESRSIHLQNLQNNHSIKAYTKAHSTLGAVTGSPLAQQKSNLRKSLSNFALNQSKKDDVTSVMSQSLRTMEKKMVDCRVTAKAMVEVFSQLSEGNTPAISSLLAFTGESDFSESDSEQVQTDSTPMSMADAEKTIRRQEETMRKLESEMTHLRQLVTEMYVTKFDGGKSDDQCRIQ